MVPAIAHSKLISRDVLYTLTEFQLRMKIGRAGWRGLVKKGLPSRKLGRQTYVSGAEAIDWFERLGVDSPAKHDE